MKTTAISFILLALSAFLLADDKKDPELVKVYCFSEDTEAGFEDKGATYFCKELVKRGKKKGSLEVIESMELAHVAVKYLGVETIPAADRTTFLMGGYAWTPAQYQNGARAVLSIGSFSKGFHGTGVNDVALASCWTQTEEWIRENRDTILEKAKAQQ